MAWFKLTCYNLGRNYSFNYLMQHFHVAAVPVNLAATSAQLVFSAPGQDSFGDPVSNFFKFI